MWKRGHMLPQAGWLVGQLAYQELFNFNLVRRVAVFSSLELSVSTANTSSLKTSASGTQSS